MITFSKDLLTINPAYNNSIIEFTSDVVAQLYASIGVNGFNFRIYPINGKYFFNFKSIVKTLINDNNFEDGIIPDLNSNFIYSDSTLSKTIPVTIVIVSEFSNLNEFLILNYKFDKSVEQLPSYHKKSQIEKNVRILLPSTDLVNYDLTYHEGYPADFAVNGINFGDSYYFKNITTNQVSEIYYSNDSFAKRIFLSDGQSDSTIDDILILSSTLNRIELFVNNEFQSNINVRKLESDCGVYLKWFNASGAYSYWRFDRFFETNLQTKSLEEITSFDNLQNLNKTSNILGKAANSTMSIDTIADTDAMPYLKDLLVSPVVQMYVHNSPFQKIEAFDFINVKVSDGNFKVDNTKKSKMKMSLNITLPEYNTQTL